MCSQPSTKEHSKNEIEKFQEYLLSWAKDNFHEFPWRDTDDPYRILVSEFMLHRTRAQQVVPIYKKFVSRYPALKYVSAADQDELKSLLEPLGLNWRIENMINALKKISKKYNEVPLDFKSLKSIHGIGQYIAGATVCFSKNAHVPLIDTNILRVIGRYWGREFNENTRKRKDTREFISTVTSTDNPSKLYYAIIDHAHSVCLPRNPECEKCPLSKSGCVYYRDSMTPAPS